MDNTNVTLDYDSDHLVVMDIAYLQKLAALVSITDKDTLGEYHLFAGRLRNSFIKSATVEFHHNLNRRDGFCLSKFWKLLLVYPLIEYKKPPSYDSHDWFLHQDLHSGHTVLLDGTHQLELSLLL